MKNKALQYIADKLDKLNVPFWLEGGSMLGAYRDGDFPKDDRDIDLMTFEKYEDEVAKIPEVHGHLRNNFVTMNIYGTPIDIYFATKVMDYYHWECNGNNRMAHKKFFDSLDKIQFLGREYNVPSHLEEYLVLKYGKWQDPKFRQFDELLIRMTTHDVYTSGAFDMFHIGHLNLLQNAKKCGERLIVGVSTDWVIRNQKGVEPVIPFYDRCEIANALDCVDLVIPEYDGSIKSQQKKVAKLRINKFVKGDDWQGKYDELETNVIYVPHTPDISTTILKEKICKS